MPQQLDRDPNALATLLRGQTQIPRYTEEEEQLQSMIPEEQLYQMQDAQSDAGRARGGPYSVSSRDSLRQSGVAGLRQMLGITQAEGQAKAYPNRVAGEYGLQEARIKGGFDVESAKQKAVADSAQHGRNQQFQTEQQSRQQTFQSGQGELNRQALSGRATQAQGAAQSGREYNQGQINQRAADKKPFSPIDYIKSLFGSGETAAAPSAAPTGNAAQAVESFRQNPTTANATFAQLEAAGEFEGATPEELAEFQQLWGR